MHEPDRRLVQESMTDEQLTELLQTLRCSDDVSPRPGFYAKVMDRIEAQQKSSIWSVFLEPVFSKRLAFASMALIVLLGVAFFQAGSQEEETFAFDNGAPVVFVDGASAATMEIGNDALRAAPVALMDVDQGRDVVLADMIGSVQEH